MSEHNKKLTEKDVVDICELYASGDYTQKELAEMYGLANCTIYNIVNGFTWKDVKRELAYYRPQDAKVKKLQSHKGVEHPAHRLTDDDVIEIRRTWANSLTQKDLARKYGVSLHTIVSIIAQHSWKHLPSVDDFRRAEL